MNNEQMNGRTLGTWGCRKSINVAFFLFLAKICGELGNKWDFIFPFSWLDTMRAKNRAVIAVHRKRWTSAQKQRCEETVSGKRFGIDNRDMLRCQFWHRKTFQIRHTILRKPDPHRSRFIQKKKCDLVVGVGGGYPISHIRLVPDSYLRLAT